ncbi:related to WD40 repeat protein CreC [Melanopsichium pennsylvanicum]|uniref:Related to WD40 repeat protein CreC n=2 Tax=Melanopsichium pennsylvanicum TaxID=63383 RepID=A0AAJ4XJM0_9BASI|nr:related to WD40 repeat protein CreC [Melanopsichium pennsylvanicum 4]SNX83859.1 related to WD40 repeat protein CreC [Melanopsichium pennsylvanicum]
MAYPMFFPPTAMRPLPGGTTLVSAQPTAPAAPAMTTESFDAPEGMYVCTSRFTPPPQPMIHLNPVPTTQLGLSAVYPTPRVSTVSLRYPATKNTKASDLDLTTSNRMLLEAPLASQGIDAPSSSLTGGLPPGSAGPSAGIAGIGGPGMGFSGLGETMGRLSAKPTRPKNSLKNTSSNFVNRMMTHPDLAKILAARSDTEHFTFLTNARSFFWLADTNGRTKESLARITFSASPSAHDVNQFTRAHDRLDIVIGFVTGDLIWLDPIASKYSRINKGGCITGSAVTQVRWLPGSENLIMAAHADGTILVYDREREDSSDFAPATWDFFAESTAFSSSAALQTALGGSATPSSAAMSASQTSASNTSSSSNPTAGAAGAFGTSITESRPILGARTVTISTTTIATQADGDDANMSSSSGSDTHLPKSKNSLTPGTLSQRRHAADSSPEGPPLLLVTKPGSVPIASGLPSGASLHSREYQQAAAAAAVANSANGNGLSGKGRETPWSRLNPVSHWSVCKSRITDFAFCPDHSHVAIVAEDGILRIADINSERLLDTFESYFGGFNCAVWSPDGKFVLTGGQDDLVSVWAPREGRIVARCQGHTSFVTGLAWDPWRWSGDERTYRFASVGEDCKMILWDFSSAALNRPKTHAPHNAGHRRSSVGLGSTYSLVDKHGSSSFMRSPGSLVGGRRISTSYGPSSGIGAAYDMANVTDDTIRHLTLPRSEVAILQPVVTVVVDGEIPTGLRFGPDRVAVVRKNAGIDTFTRPLPKRSASVVVGGNVGMERGSLPVGARTNRQGMTGRVMRVLPAISIPRNGVELSANGRDASATTPTTPRHAILGNGVSA